VPFGVKQVFAVDSLAIFSPWQVIFSQKSSADGQSLVRVGIKDTTRLGKIFKALTIEQTDDQVEV